MHSKSIIPVLNRFTRHFIPDVQALKVFYPVFRDGTSMFVVIQFIENNSYTNLAIIWMLPTFVTVNGGHMHARDDGVLCKKSV
jgi:hypothetical protein